MEALGSVCTPFTCSLSLSTHHSLQYFLGAFEQFAATVHRDAIEVLERGRGLMEREERVGEEGAVPSSEASCLRRREGDGDPDAGSSGSDGDTAADVRGEVLARICAIKVIKYHVRVLFRHMSFACEERPAFREMAEHGIKMVNRRFAEVLERFVAEVRESVGRAVIETLRCGGRELVQRSSSLY
jgi:hypothetical protein